MAIEPKLLKTIRDYYVFECANTPIVPNLSEIADKFDVDISDLRISYRTGKWEDYRREENHKIALAQRKVEDSLAENLGIDLAKELTVIFTDRLEKFKTYNTLVDSQLTAYLEGGEASINQLIRIKELLLREGNQLSNDIRSARDSIKTNDEDSLDNLELTDLFTGLEIIRKVRESKGVVKPVEIDHISEGRKLFERLEMEDDE